MIAPRINAVRAVIYKGLIGAKIPKKRKECKENNEHQQFLFSWVNYRGEFCMMFNSDCQLYSADDMNKIRVGPTPAVSRYHQIFHFYMVGNTLNTLMVGNNLSDHDFSNPRHLIVCSSYQMQCDNTNHDIFPGE